MDGVYVCDAGEVRSFLLTIDHRVCAGCGGLEGDDAVAFCRLGVFSSSFSSFLSRLTPRALEFSFPCRSVFRHA